jgi:hypothetical protein
MTPPKWYPFPVVSAISAEKSRFAAATAQGRILYPRVEEYTFVAVKLLMVMLVLC